MADFVLTKRPGFTFALAEEPEKVYELKSLKTLSFQEAKHMADIDEENDLMKKGEMIRDFILERVPELKSKDLSDMEMLEIFNAYAMHEGTQSLGESKASHDSSKNTARR